MERPRKLSTSAAAVACGGGEDVAVRGAMGGRLLMWRAWLARRLGLGLRGSSRCGLLLLLLLLLGEVLLLLVLPWVGRRQRRCHLRCLLLLLHLLLLLLLLLLLGLLRWSQWQWRSHLRCYLHLRVVLLLLLLLLCWLLCLQLRLLAQ